MKISIKSPLTGNVNTRDLPVTKEQLDRYSKGQDLIQNIFPDLKSYQREFIQSGYIARDWYTIFPPHCNVHNEFEPDCIDCSDAKDEADKKVAEDES